MELEVFAGQEKSELSMIEVARAILETRGRNHEMYFNDLVNEIQNYLEKSNSDIREALPLFYTELNVDGSFIPLGDNKWGLRSLYAIDEVDEEIIALEDNDEETPKKRKKKRVNAFMDGDENAIDYNDDDPEDEDSYEADPVLNYDEDNPDDEKSEVEAYDAEINEIAPDDLGEEVELNEEDEDYSDDEVDSEDEE
ncbi:DNA-directed RNA polymerase subunit delta [Streptococcus constellatus subsp. pharyngis]|uniref:Probable DNA-directed RNA polymerase subunit delta n=1 Tax=Streptococcus constellatus subsp. pharyngis SK1060 = CCUG 46377 TaxID=1035184 RepID=F9P7I5_STRCV|nr:DNA-directed RNA polymerase subunit delta [Streptococcus constellatus]AGU73364.1 DNA-directed RNA polymerase subunit delta [Streptococcus constellatus subsp. pharyngis C232]AGU75118.1 DNA-directed RNA polymerase subunit delta [Streptococcus constellatus subsp. pharyngis C818]AGU80509.1 DNA-directed RNA polymerase subunit delta [Streptococcus constellatus subsp. pharyngis C1050]EGV08259.1 DNA-directed RNA polymerase, delta subunit [Streptococcus constellatus subsp. pharyngis SK1060 = CCUG 463